MADAGRDRRAEYPPAVLTAVSSRWLAHRQARRDDEHHIRRCSPGRSTRGPPTPFSTMTARRRSRRAHPLPPLPRLRRQLENLCSHVGSKPVAIAAAGAGGRGCRSAPSVAGRAPAARRISPVGSSRRSRCEPAAACQRPVAEAGQRSRGRSTDGESSVRREQLDRAARSLLPAYRPSSSAALRGRGLRIGEPRQRRSPPSAGSGKAISSPPPARREAPLLRSWRGIRRRARRSRRPAIDERLRTAKR